jgi:hypothetical protein
MNPRPLLHRLAPAAALAGVALVLAGCGQATGSEAVAPDPSAPSSTTAGGGTSGTPGSDAPASSDPDPTLAQWPANGCDARSVVSVDYGRMPTGFDTPEEAVENSPAAGLPEGVLTLAPYAGKGPAQVWVVDPGTDEIQAEVSVFQGPDGWFVDGVMTCG